MKAAVDLGEAHKPNWSWILWRSHGVTSQSEFEVQWLKVFHRNFGKNFRDSVLWSEKSYDCLEYRLPHFFLFFFLRSSKLRVLLSLKICPIAIDEGICEIWKILKFACKSKNVDFVSHVFRFYMGRWSFEVLIRPSNSPLFLPLPADPFNASAPLSFPFLAIRTEILETRDDDELFSFPYPALFPLFKISAVYTILD